MRGPSETILKAHLSLRPSSGRAVTSFLEALALWEGAPVRAALVVDESSKTSSATTLYRDLFGVFGESTPLYQLEWIPRAARRRRDGLTGLGDFGDRAPARSLRRAMNKVTDEQTEDVLRLHFVEHLPTRQIAARLGMARRTIRSVIAGRQTAPAPRKARVTQLAEHESFIKQELARVPSMNAPAMLERLRTRGYTGRISVLRDRMRVLRPKPHIEVFSHFEVRPGERHSWRCSSIRG